MQADILQSVAFTWVFKLYLTDHITPATGKTVAVTLWKFGDGAAFSNPSVGASNATEIANGWYKFTSSTTDTGALGPLIWLGTCTGCDNADQAYQVIKATNGGMTGIPDAVAGANAGLPILSSSATTLAYTVSTVTTVTNQLTAAQIATGVWQDSTAGDFTTSSSIGKSLYTGGVVPGGTNGLFIAGTNAATVITTSLTTHFIGTVDTVTTVTNQLTAAAIATGVWTDTTAGDFTTLTSPGKIIFAQLGGAFTTTASSVFSTAALANAPSGGGSGDITSINGTPFAGVNIPAILADGVAHGGTPGSSTATLALDHASFISATNSAFYLESNAANKYGLECFSSLAAGAIFSGGPFGLLLYGDQRGLGCDADSGVAAEFSTFTTGPAATFTSAEGNVIEITADGTDGHGITIQAVGTNKHGINIAGGSVSGNAINLTQTSGYPIYGKLGAARDVTAITDTNLTINDAFQAAVAAIGGQQTVVSTTYTTMTSAGTTLRIFTLDSSTSPTSRT